MTVPPPARRRRLGGYHWLALIPPIGMLSGVPFVNRARPLVLGMPPLMAWMIAWILITSLVMGVIYTIDHRRERQEP